MPVTNAKWQIRSLLSIRHREWPMFQEPMLPIWSAPTTERMPAADNAAIVQNAPAEVNAGVAEAANNAPVFFNANNPTNPEAFKKVRAAITEVSLRDSDVAAYMQTIEDGPRGAELEPDNNPQAPVLQEPEYLAIGKSPSGSPGCSSASRGQQEEELVGRNFVDNQDPPTDHALDSFGPESNEPMVNPLFLVVDIQRQVRAFSLEGRSSKPLHSNNHDDESTSQDPQSSIFEKDLKPEPPNKANKWQHPGKSATTRAQSKLFSNPHSISKISTIANARGVRNGPTRRRLDDLARTGL